ncbi:hypothetical protein [Lutibacter sp.]|uniref:hypothetical protein n=1 Tax=Lutibacter sp. TaxID=1925666 RepID=UPI0035640E3A
MNTLKNKKKSFASDIDYHLSEIETDLSRAKFDNNRNINLTRLFDNLLNRVAFLKKLALKEPKAYFNTIYSEMKRLYKEAFGELDGFYVKISFKENPDSSKMGIIKLSINKKVMQDEKGE